MIFDLIKRFFMVNPVFGFIGKAGGSSDGEAPYSITGSVRYRTGNASSIVRTHTANGNNKKFAVSMWVKRGSLGVAQTLFMVGNTTANDSLALVFETTDKLSFRNYGSIITQKYNFVRETASWIHLYVAVDTTLSEKDRAQVFVNGIRQPDIVIPITANQVTQANTNTKSISFGYPLASWGYGEFDGHMADVHYIDGQETSVYDFISISEGGRVTPKAYNGSYGTCGFHYDFKTTWTISAIGADVSGNNNHAAVYNFAINGANKITYDISSDSPQHNYPVLNVHAKSPASVVYDGSRRSYCSTSNYTNIPATQPIPSSGMWYWEGYIHALNASFPMFGIAKDTFLGFAANNGYYTGYTVDSWGLYNNTGGFVTGNAVQATYSPILSGETVMMAFDSTTGRLWMGKEGTWFNNGNPSAGTGYVASGISGTVFPCISEYKGSSGVINFGQVPFKFTPPSGFSAINSSTKPQPAVKNPRKHYNVICYNGTGTSQQIGDVAKQIDTYLVEKSIRLRGAGSFTRSPVRSATPTAFTISCWIKIAALGVTRIIFEANQPSQPANKLGVLELYSDNYLRYRHWTALDADAAKSNIPIVNTNTWIHVHFTKALGQPGVLSIDGVAQTKTTSYSDDSDIFSSEMFIGETYKSSNLFNGLMSEFIMVDGYSLPPTNFGQFDINGGWIPKAPDVPNYGPYGCYLEFKDASAATATAIGKDTSGNGNNWTPGYIDVNPGSFSFDSLYCTPSNDYMALSYGDKASAITITNCGYGAGSAASAGGVRGNQRIPATGKFYFEGYVSTTTTGTVVAGIGLAKIIDNVSGTAPTSANISISAGTATSINNYTTGFTIAAQTFTTATTLKIAIDASRGRVWLGYNDVWYDGNGGTTGDPANGLRPTFLVENEALFPYFFAKLCGVYANFGQVPFKKTPPSGFLALSEDNIQSNQLGMVNPAYVHIKNRGTTAVHAVFDKLRPLGSYTQIHAALSEVSAPDSLLKFNKDNVIIGNNAVINTVGNNYVSWIWSAGAAVVNTNGTIQSTVMANQEAGFSIVKWTGTGSAGSIGHGLGRPPKFIVIKNAITNVAFLIYTTAIDGSNDYMYYNATTAKSNAGEATPTDNVFYVAASNGSANGNTYTAECYADMPGFMKIGVYTGKSSADGHFVYTGFRCRSLQIKRVDAAGRYIRYDIDKETYRPITVSDHENTFETKTVINTAAAEETGGFIEVFSNGFKPKSTSGTFADENTANGIYLYIAIADLPFI